MYEAPDRYKRLISARLPGGESAGLAIRGAEDESSPVRDVQLISRAQLAPFFTAASSFKGKNKNDPHFLLSRALNVADWNLHDEDSVKLLHAAGGDWAFYNGGNRWTYGAYMYKAAKQHGKFVELNCNPMRLDLNDVYCAAAKQQGIPIVMNTDSHNPDGFDVLRYGILQARRAGLTKADVANAGTWPQLKKLVGRR